MTIKSIRTGWTGISALAGNPVIGDYESIQTHTVGSSGTSAIEFTSIPSGYQHLQVRGIARGSSAATTGDFRMQANGDTGSNYSWHLLIGDGGGSIASFSATSQTFGRIAYSTFANISANIFGAFVIDILDYSNTNKNKTFRTLSGADTNDAGAMTMNSDLWMSTNAITSLKLYPGSGNFVQNSHFALYGIR